MYSNFEKLGRKYGLTKLSLSYDLPESTEDAFSGGIQFSFFGTEGSHSLGFHLSQKSHGSGFYPVLEINWADMEQDEKITFGDSFSDDPKVHAWIVDSLLEVFAVAVQQTYLEILTLGTTSELSECGTKLAVPELSAARNFVDWTDCAHLH